MTRSDGLLHTGMTSRTALTQVRNRRNRQATKRASYEQLKPIHEELLNKIQSERDGIAQSILGYVNASMDTEEIKETLVAMRMYDEFLKSFKLDVFNIMRERERGLNDFIAELQAEAGRIEDGTSRDDEGGDTTAT